MRAAYAVMAFAIALAAMPARAFEFHGYFRDGAGFNSKGGGQVCFALPGSEFKARLGNECNHYWELTLSQVVYKDATGVEAKGEIMPAYYNDMTKSDPGSSSFTYTQQAWGGVKLPQLGGATVWAGQRYYRRHNVESLDWFYWNPYQNNGAVGIEDIDLGFGKLALAVGRVDAGFPTGVPATTVNVATYMRPEIRVYGIPLIADGTLEVGLDLAIAMDQSDALDLANPALGAGQHRDAMSPWVTVEWMQDKLLGGWNKLTFQYAQGAEAKMSSGVLGGATSDQKQWRIVEQLVFAPVPEVSGQLVFVYQDQDKLLNGGVAAGATNNGAQIFTGEVRPSYHFNDYFKLQLDAIYQSLSVKNSTTSAATMFKLTVAPTLVMGRGFFARPELRLFLTYAAWNDEAVALATALGGNIGNGAFGTDKNGFSYGAQFEVWF